MKTIKLVIGFLMVMLMAATVFAQGNGNLIANNVQLKVQEQSQVKGLENAMLSVQNQEQVRHLEQVLAKIQEQRMERLNKLEGLKIVQEEADAEITAEGIGEAKLFNLLKMQKKFKYVITEESSVRYQHQWYDNFFTFEE